MKILLTGGSGLLGQYLKIKADRPSHKNLDITNAHWLDVYSQIHRYDLIVHVAAYTDVQKAETKKQECFKVNVNGTLNLLTVYPNTPIVYISSEYSYRPVNFYSLTKHIAEKLIMEQKNYLIIRTLFKATPWPFDKAFKDQMTQGSYVDKIAPKIDKVINDWSRRGKRMIYVGHGGRKTMLELARQTKPDVIPNSVDDMEVPIPKDYR